MSKISISDIKQKFEAGDLPSEQDFIDFIDTSTSNVIVENNSAHVLNQEDSGNFIQYKGGGSATFSLADFNSCIDNEWSCYLSIETEITPQIVVATLDAAIPREFEDTDTAIEIGQGMLLSLRKIDGVLVVKRINFNTQSIYIAETTGFSIRAHMNGGVVYAKSPSTSVTFISNQFNTYANNNWSTEIVCENITGTESITVIIQSGITLEDGSAGGSFTLNSDEIARVYKIDNKLKYVVTNKGSGGGSGGFPSTAYVASLPNGDLGNIQDGDSVPAFADMDEFLAFASQAVIDAYIQSNSSMSWSGFSTTSVEVGTNYDAPVNVTFDLGQINNGDNTVAGDVSGDLLTVNISSPSNANAYIDNSVTGNASSGTASTHVLTLGTNTWTLTGTNLAGTTTYTDSNGDPQTITSIENAKADTIPNSVGRNKTGLYYRYVYKGNQNTSPTNSAGVRALTEKAFLSTSNTGNFDIFVPAGTQEVTFYCIRGKSINVIDTGNLNNNITGSFVRTDIDVDDANADNALYEKNTIFLGLGGFPSDTNFDVTIS